MYLQLFIHVLLFTTITSSSPFDWEEFKHNYNKKYATVSEEAERKQIFLENVNRMHEYRKQNPHATFTIGINHLMDRRTEELVTKSKSMFKASRMRLDERQIQSKKPIPLSLDWREQGVISSVYNQGMQPNDASVLAVEMIESYQAVRSGKLERGSIAQVAACCDNTIDILNCTLNKMGGRLCKEDDYDASSGTCNLNSCQPFAFFNNVKTNTPNDESIMLRWIQDSPLFVGIYAAQFAFQIYQKGIYSEPDCPKEEPDHVVQVVGYGSGSGKLYWICKNSWGSEWGDQGYIRIERGVNMCGIANYAAQVEYITSNARRAFNTSYVYLVILCIGLRLFLHSK